MTDKILDSFDHIKKMRKIKEDNRERQEYARVRLRGNYGFIPKEVIEEFCSLDVVPDKLFLYTSAYGSMAGCIYTGELFPEVCAVLFGIGKEDRMYPLVRLAREDELVINLKDENEFSAKLATFEVSWTYESLFTNRDDSPYLDRKLNMLVILEKIVNEIKENYYSVLTEKAINEIIDQHEMVDYTEAHRKAICGF